MKRFTVKRKFVGEPEGHLYVYAASGRNYQWLEIGCGKDVVTIEAVRDAREVAALLLEWADRNDKPAKRRKRGGK